VERANPDVAALDAYLAHCRRRLRARSAARALAAVGVVGCLAGAAALALAAPLRSWSGTVWPAAWWLWGSAIVATATVAIVLFRQTQIRAVRRIERAVPAFDGRAVTFADAVRSGREPGRGRESALLPLLAADALVVAHAHPPARAVSHGSIFAPLCAALLAAAGLLALTSAGESAAPRVAAQPAGAGRIDVHPGSLSVARGSDVRVTARGIGVAADDLRIHAVFVSDPARLRRTAVEAGNAASDVGAPAPTSAVGAGTVDAAGLDASSLDEAWEIAPMRRGEGDERTFSFVALDTAVRYYVSAGDVKSQTFSIDVVELPRVERIKLVYRYPKWTHRPPREVEPGGDIVALPGTEVEVEVEADRPLDRAVLLTDGSERPLETSADQPNVGRATLRVDDAGAYSIAARTDAGPARLAGEFAITLLDDGGPAVQIARPARDRQVSSIEELTTWVAAQDDFHVEAVELHYSVNGSEWVVANLGGGDVTVRGEHVLSLEDVRVPEEKSENGSDTRAIAPGDVVAYYGVARDREQTARTDIFFASVQRFDRTFSQSQQSGGGGGMGGQDGLADIARRQREISVATFKVLPQGDSGGSPSQASEDRVELLRDLQEKLAEQVSVFAA
jgi:hypothetical protein